MNYPLFCLLFSIISFIALISFFISATSAESTPLQQQKRLPCILFLKKTHIIIQKTMQTSGTSHQPHAGHATFPNHSGMASLLSRSPESHGMGFKRGSRYPVQPLPSLRVLNPNFSSAVRAFVVLPAITGILSPFFPWTHPLSHGVSPPFQQQSLSRFVDTPKRVYAGQKPISPEARRGTLKAMRIHPAVPFATVNPAIMKAIPATTRITRSRTPTFLFVFMSPILPGRFIRWFRRETKGKRYTAGALPGTRSRHRMPNPFQGLKILSRAFRLQACRRRKKRAPASSGPPMKGIRV